MAVCAFGRAFVRVGRGDSGRSAGERRRKSGCYVPFPTRYEGDRVAPDLLDLFASARHSNGSVSEPTPEGVDREGDGDERAVGGEQRRAVGFDACPVTGFERSQALFAGLVEWVAAEPALGLPMVRLLVLLPGR